MHKQKVTKRDQIPKDVMNLFCQHSNITDEILSINQTNKPSKQNNKRKKVDSETLNYWIHEWITMKSRLIFPFRFLEFDAPVHEVEMRLLLTSNFENFKSLSVYKKVLADHKICESTVMIFKRNAIYDWTCFEFRRQEDKLGCTSNTKRFIRSQKTLLRSRFMRGQEMLKLVEEVNFGKVMTEEHLNYEIMIHISNITELIKLDLELKGEDEYDERLHAKYFQNWMETSEILPWAKNLMFRDSWKLLSQKQFEEHKEYQEFLSNCNLVELVREFHKDETAEEQENIAVRAYHLWKVHHQRVGLLEELVIFNEEEQLVSRDKETNLSIKSQDPITVQSVEEPIEDDTFRRESVEKVDEQMELSIEPAQIVLSVLDSSSSAHSCSSSSNSDITVIHKSLTSFMVDAKNTSTPINSQSNRSRKEDLRRRVLK